MPNHNLAEIDTSLGHMEISNFYEYTSDHRFSNILHSPKREQFASFEMKELSGLEDIETPVQSSPQLPDDYFADRLLTKRPF